MRESTTALAFGPVPLLFLTSVRTDALGMHEDTPRERRLLRRHVGKYGGLVLLMVCIAVILGAFMTEAIGR